MGASRVLRCPRDCRQLLRLRSPRRARFRVRRAGCDLCSRTVRLLLPPRPAGSLVHAGHVSVHVSSWSIRESKGTWAGETPSRGPWLAARRPGPHRRCPVPASLRSGSFPDAQALSCPGASPEFFPQEAWPPPDTEPPTDRPRPQGQCWARHGCCPRTSTEPCILGADLSLPGWLVPLRQGPQGPCTQ